jgi:hypothetical protein
MPGSGRDSSIVRAVHDRELPYRHFVTDDRSDALSASRESSSGRLDVGALPMRVCDWTSHRGSRRSSTRGSGADLTSHYLRALVDTYAVRDGPRRCSLKER